MPLNERTLSQYRDSALSTNAVLKNTYMLLSLTLLFSAATASFAVATNAGFGSSIVAFILSLVLLFVTSALRNSGWGIISVFAFTGCMGYALGPMLNQFIHGYT